MLLPSLHVALRVNPLLDIVNWSRVLCLFKILYHKYIFLDVKSIFDLVQVLLCAGLYVYEEEEEEQDNENDFDNDEDVNFDDNGDEEEEDEEEGEPNDNY